MNTATKIDWAAVGRAERQLLSDVLDFENEATRIDRTTYEDKDQYYLRACGKLRQAISRYGVSLIEAGIQPSR